MMKRIDTKQTFSKMEAGTARHCPPLTDCRLTGGILAANCQNPRKHQKTALRLKKCLTESANCGMIILPLCRGAFVVPAF